ncbi:uncharacterized protein LOC116851953 [Odontomachus brunneus]|uniref:uncharacterized protein LOC116851953 n=1 Tax=Odontomachus brunneus TaxID=486640 RepID=UPI0013F23BC0|nr:uncharacterized protein LOC116851953 [Odontomachus brunneus]
MTILLLSEIEHKEDFNSQPQKALWKHICAAINEFSYNVTADQCCSKWKSLKRKYKQIKDNNNRSGAGKQQWVHFNSIDNIMKTRPEINPISLASNIGGFRMRKVENIEHYKLMINDENADETASAVFSLDRNAIDRDTRRPISRRSRLEPYWAVALREQRERHHKENVRQRQRFLFALK